MDSNISCTNSAEGVFYFDPEDAIYTEHFPGNPVVPGSMIIHAFLTAAREKGLASTFSSLGNFKFRRFVSPGEYRYSLEPSGTDLRCRLFDGATVVATGALEV